MENENHGLRQLYAYAFESNIPYKDRLRSTNVQLYEDDDTLLPKEKEFVRDTTLDPKDWWK